jgi:hypothetical protein
MTRRRHNWPPEDDAIVRALYPTTNTQALAERIGVTVDALLNRAHKLGITKRNPNAWTPEQTDALVRLYPTHTAEDIAQLIGRATESVQHKASKLGLKKSREWVAERARQAMRNPNHPGRNAGFQKGHATWNKGIKGLRLSPKTEWKKGQLPHTWRPIGSTRVTADGYLERKVSDTRVTRDDYVPVHHLVWRMHGNGPIPAGHALVFRDGNPRNLDINNLELITRAELMRRNTVHRYPEPVKQAIRAKASFSRQLNNIERKQQEASA